MDRKLAAILATDLVGYSRLMGVDEAGTLAALKAHRSELFDPLVAQHNGRVVKLMGDGALIEFGSAVDAVECAIDIQRAMAERNNGVDEQHRLAYRMGINLGDIIVDDDDIYGDGVNVAARLESAAHPGGVCISGTIYDQIEGKIDLVFEDLGPQQVKNIAKPVRMYQLNASAVAPPEVDGASRDDRPSIAALPFNNMSGDPEQEYFTDGITEDIITDLSKVSGLFVIARNTTFAYKGKSVNVQQVAGELGVRYVLEGSVRKAGNRVRVTAQLIDGKTGGHVWADRYDRDLQDIFAVQDELTREIVDALRVRLTEGEKKQISHRETDNLEAYDFLLRGREFYLRFVRESNELARQMYASAIELDPNFAAAYAELARVHVQARNHGWTDSLADSLQQAFDLAKRAVELDDQLAQAHVVLGFIHMWRMKHVQAIAACHRGLERNPNHADGHMYMALAQSFAGNPVDGIGWVEKAIRLNPAAPFWYNWALGSAQFALQEFGKAESACEKAAAIKPSFLFAHLFRAAALGQLERDDDARVEGQACMEIVPGLTLAWVREVVPYKDPDIVDRFVDGLARAGIQN